MEEKFEKNRFDPNKHRDEVQAVAKMMSDLLEQKGVSIPLGYAAICLMKLYCEKEYRISEVPRESDSAHH